jgi:murein DD-endopeptidase MepM/ murein hydrolase activator NlpD
LFGFGRDADRRALLSFAFPGLPPQRHVIHVKPREFEPEAIDGLPEDMVKLDPETRKALALSNKRVEKVRHKVTNTQDFSDGFRWPLKGRVTSTYGRERILNGEDKGIHWGIDIAAPVGRKVRAPAAGVVVFAEENVPLSGNLLIVDHGHGLTSSFLHLNRFRVEVGTEVRRGQVIADVGNTGRTTGPHLDWRMNLEDLRVDPQLLLGK